jgi:hypothetical protein
MANMSDRSSIRSGSSLGGYETPDEELPAGRSVRFLSSEEELAIAAADDDAKVIDEIIDRKTFRNMKRPKLGQSLLARIFRKFPRCYAFWCGMVFPLWFLVLLSLIGGKILADFEFEEEVQSNDNAMRLRLVQERYNELVDRLEEYSPAFCHIHYQNGVPQENLTASWSYLLETETSLVEFIEREQEIMINEGAVSIQNITSFSKYLKACGNIVDNYTDTLQQAFLYDGYDESLSLSFNWIRCVNVSWTTPEYFNRIFQPTQKYIDAAHPATQSKAFSDAWRESQQKIRDSYSNQLKNSSDNYREMRLQAFNYSIHEASGGTSCSVNVPSAGKILLD